MPNPIRFIKLSIAAAIVTILLKTGAWLLTDSVGFLSDALESFVNLAGALFALWMISIAHSPADEKHPFGHSKAEYFSSGFEGLLIFGAGGSILIAATERFFHPQAIQALGWGMVLSLLATFINFGVARTLFKAAENYHSVALKGDAKHLMTDVWTSLGVMLGIGAVGMTGLSWLDPLIAAAVGLNILREGWALLLNAADGLMDRALPEDELEYVLKIFKSFEPQEVLFTDLRTRLAGYERHITFNLLVPRHWSVEDAHHLADEIEHVLAEGLHHAKVIIHVEPLSCSIKGDE